MLPYICKRHIKKHNILFDGILKYIGSYIYLLTINFIIKKNLNMLEILWSNYSYLVSDFQSM